MSNPVPWAAQSKAFRKQMLREITIYAINFIFQIGGALCIYKRWLQQSLVSENTSKNIDTIQKNRLLAETVVEKMMPS